MFLRAGQIGVLDSRRADVLDNAVKRIQRQLRTFVARRDFVSTRAAALGLQAFCRGQLFLPDFHQKCKLLFLLTSS